MRWAKVTQSFTSFQMNHRKVLEFIKTSELCSFRFEELKNVIGLQLSSGIKHIFPWNINCNVQLPYKYKESSTYFIISPLFGIVISIHVWIWKLVSCRCLLLDRQSIAIAVLVFTLPGNRVFTNSSKAVLCQFLIFAYLQCFVSQFKYYSFQEVSLREKDPFLSRKHPWRRSKGSTCKCQYFQTEWSLAGTWGQNSSVSSRRYTALPDMWETNLQNLQISHWHPQASNCNLQADCANNFSQNNSPQSGSTTPASSQVWNLPAQYRHRCS